MTNASWWAEKSEAYLPAIGDESATPLSGVVACGVERKENKEGRTFLCCDVRSDDEALIGQG